MKRGRVRTIWTDYKEGFENAIPFAEDLAEVLEGIEMGFVGLIFSDHVINPIINSG